MRNFKSVVFCILLLLLSFIINSSKLSSNKARKFRLKISNRKSLKNKNSHKNKVIIHTHSVTSHKSNTKTNTESDDCGCGDD
jgi:hypothetical protein